MTETEHDLKEFVEAIVGETKAMLDVIETVKEECIAILDNDRDYSIAIEAAEEIRGELIRGTYSRVLSVFMQPPAAEADDEVEGTTLADRLGETASGQPTRAGRGQRG